MATMKRKLYDALRSIGIADTQAADVAEALSEDILALRIEMEKLYGEVRTLRWMVGANMAMTLGTLWLVLQVLSRLPAT